MYHTRVGAISVKTEQVKNADIMVERRLSDQSVCWGVVKKAPLASSNLHVLFLFILVKKQNLESTQSIPHRGTGREKTRVIFFTLN